MPVSTRRAWLTFAVASTAVFMVFLDTTVMYVAFPDLQASFDELSPAALSWVLNSYTIAVAVVLIPAGRLADRVGCRHTFLGSVALFCLGSALCGGAPAAHLLVAARVAQAVGAAGLVPSSLALVLHAFPRQRVPVAVAAWSAVGALAGAVGPTVGAGLVETFSWRAVFYLNVPVAGGVLVFGRRALSESRESNPGPLPDPAGTGILAAGIALVALGIVQTDAWGWSDRRTIVALSAGLGLTAGFARRCGRVPVPLVDPELFNINGFRWASISIFLFSMAFTANFFTTVQLLTGLWGWSVLKAGAAISAGPAIVALLAPVAGRLVTRWGQRRLLVPGGLIYGSGALWLVTHVSVEPNWVGDVLPGTLLAGIGVTLCLPQISSAALQGLPADVFAAGSAVLQVWRQVGGTVGISLAIALIGQPPDLTPDRFQRVWLLVMSCGVLVSLAAMPLRRPTPAPASGPVPAVSCR